MQLQHSSTSQLLLQPSPSPVFASSQTSVPPTLPSPQTFSVVVVVDDVVDVDVVVEVVVVDSNGSDVVVKQIPGVSQEVPSP